VKGGKERSSVSSREKKRARALNNCLHKAAWHSIRIGHELMLHLFIFISFQ